MTTQRRASIVAVVVGAVAFAVLAALLVPWQWVPGGHIVRVAPRQLFSPAQISAGERYSSMQRHLGDAAYAIDLVVALVLGLTPLGRRLVARLRGPWWLRVALGALILLLIGTVLTLPFSVRAEQHALTAGLSTQSWTGWWRDVAVSFLVSWVPTAIALLVLVGVARRAPRRWPLYVAGIAAALGVLGSFVYPVVVEPLFSQFTPMPAGQLRTRILQLAAKEHVHISDVLIADASRRTTTLNAYVSGFGDTRRVVVYDTLLRRAPESEVLVVVAHELGHAHADDVLTGTILGVCGAVAGVGLLGLLLSSGWVLRRSGTKGGAGAATDPGVVPLVLALAALASFLVSPVQNTISRAVEARADRASLIATGDLPAFVALQRRLAVTALADPTPPQWSQLWFGTHPTALQRVGIAEALCSEHRAASARCLEIGPQPPSR